MFGFMKKSAGNNDKDEAETDRLATLSSEKIGLLEQRLALNSRDGEAQKQLMIEYNRALTLYAKSRRYRNEIDVLFAKIDALRNIIRKSI